MRIEVQKRVRRPLAEVYAWCTDYRDDDPRLSRVRLRTRRVLRRTPEVVEMEETGVMAFPFRARFVVRLYPPDRWEADARSNMGESHIGYRLRPDGEATTLEIGGDVRLRGAYRLLTPFARGFVQRRMSREWDDYVRAMESGP